MPPALGLATSAGRLFAGKPPTVNAGQARGGSHVARFAPLIIAEHAAARIGNHEIGAGPRSKTMH